MFSLCSSTLGDNPDLLIEPQECLVLDGWFGRQGLFIFFNFETYFTYKIHPFQVLNSVILVTFLSGAAVTVTQF